jgi:predicted nucleic acid-binding protein
MALMFLLDTSVFTRLGAATIRRRLEEIDGDGLARTTMTDLEIGYSARNGAEWDRLAAALAAFRRIDVENHHFIRAQQVQRALVPRDSKAARCPIS